MHLKTLKYAFIYSLKTVNIFLKYAQSLKYSIKYALKSETFIRRYTRIYETNLFGLLYIILMYIVKNVY